MIIPVYNTCQYLEECINSISNQTYSNIEIIVVDDGSDQETKSKLQMLLPSINVFLVQENKGQASARNLGIQSATGDFIVFVDSDDFVSPNFCKILIGNYSHEYAVVTCFAELFSTKRSSNVYKPVGGGLDKAILNNTALGTSLFLRKELLEIKGYDESMRNGFEDWELLIRLLHSTNKDVFVVNKVLYNYRKGIVSVTTKANSMKYKLLKYIYIKNEEIYKQYYNDFISFLLFRIEKEENEKLKMYSKLEYKLGYSILKPFRFIKNILNA
ncbi:glycosyltransferase family 2 protein [Olleya namhaensis]|uniref:glycosyltransferase family 2 protein n=1 Tax=Olleya namhaensis TaxID=1144750 RepID=UPI00232FE131|nr:glycosyltransferase family A protein [Olleya namhaensis]